MKKKETHLSPMMRHRNNWDKSFGWQFNCQLLAGSQRPQHAGFGAHGGWSPLWGLAGGHSVEAVLNREMVVLCRT